ncbi:MAG: Omp28-related outer membrane protein [Saprospiraceae bacterium]|nr:Omp28-related outer membrane protein [Saprospiraceae bacterium]
MKRFLLILFIGGSFSGLFAQNTFSDNFDSYTAGAFLGVSSTKWSTWSGIKGGADDTKVSNEQAHSGANSIKFISNVSGGGPADVILPFGGRKTNGVFTMEMWMYVVTGTGAYFNWQGNAVVGQIWSIDAFFDPNGDVRFTLGTAGAGTIAKGTHLKDTWFKIKVVANMTDNNWEAFIDDKSLGSWSNPNNAVASMDIYPTSSNNLSTYYVDDVTYTYEPFVSLNLDATLSSATVRPKNLTGETAPASIKIKNVGRTKITSAEVVWSVNGGSPTTENYTLNLDSLKESAALPLTGLITYGVGIGKLDIAITKVNSNTDDKQSNNSRSVAIEGVTPAPNKKHVVEEATGTWCQWCPRGAVYMDSLTKLFPNHFIGIAVHNRDPMVFAAYDSGLATFPGFAGYPSVINNRKLLGDPSGMEPVFYDHIVELTPVILDLGAKYDATTKELTVEVKADFVEAVTGDHRFNLVIVEDGVKGTTSAYNQSNAYAGGTNGVMGGYEILPNPVPAARMTYNHVGRAIVDGWSGEQGFLPDDIPANTSYIKSYTYLIPTGYNPAKMRLVGLMMDPNGEILNANEATFDDAVAAGLFTATNDPNANVSAVKIIPNPASDYMEISLNLLNQTDLAVEILDLMGRTIIKKEYGLQNGEIVLPIQTSLLDNGNYILRLYEGNKMKTQKLVVAH